MIPNGSIGSGGRPAKGSSASSSSKASPPAALAAASAGSPPSSAVTAIHLRPGPTSATRAAYLGWVMAATQSAFSMKKRTSAATDRVLVVTPTAPATAQPSQAMTNSGLLSAWTRTRSPLEMPRRPRPAAKRHTSWCSWR